jgi:hypothetical protein
MVSCAITPAIPGYPRYPRRASGGFGPPSFYVRHTLAPIRSPEKLLTVKALGRIAYRILKHAEFVGVLTVDDENKYLRTSQVACYR